MQELVIYGAGGFGREIRVLIDQINEVKPSWKILGFVDDHIHKNVVDDLPVFKKITDVPHQNENLSIVIAVADPSIRQSIRNNLTSKSYRFPTIVHPNTNLGDTKRNKIGEGCIITTGCVLTTGIVIHNFVIINLATTLGHDVNLGSYCTIMPGCNLSGYVTIGEKSLVGTGVQILQNLSIGKNCRVGAGAVVTKSFEDNTTIIGVPAHIKL
jgi:sugar O-acyltransferase (sialic acid O-acetyltransferase NeuD family)